MAAVFMEILKMSFAASWLIIAVVILRLLFGKVSKNLRYILWALVGVRLICPFSIESAFSLVPSQESMWSAVQGQMSEEQLETDKGTSFSEDLQSDTSPEQEAIITDKQEAIITDKQETIITDKQETIITDKQETIITDKQEAIITDKEESSQEQLSDGEDIVQPQENTDAAILAQKPSEKDNLQDSPENDRSSQNSENRQQAVIPKNLIGIACAVWIVGTIAILLYALGSYCRLRQKVAAAICEKDESRMLFSKSVYITSLLGAERMDKVGIWICDEIQSPFILGMFRPRIYMPSTVNEAQKPYILIHEREHLKYHDNVWKPLGLLILAIHWFNPLVWLAYILMCRDIEFACDERVIRSMDNQQKKAYMESLLLCSSPLHFQSVYSVAFGEISIRKRIQNVLQYKKPALGVLSIGVFACVILAFCFMTNPTETTGLEEHSNPTETTRLEENRNLKEMLVNIGSNLLPEKTAEMKEGVLYETNADLNHDGISDLVQVVDDDLAIESYAIRIFLGDTNGGYVSKAVEWISPGESTSFPVCRGIEWTGAYALAEKEGKEYLVYTRTNEYNGSAIYAYKIYYIGENNELVALRDHYMKFACDPMYPQWDKELHREDVIPHIQGALSSWIENGRMLVYTGLKEVYIADDDKIVTSAEYYGEIFSRSDAEALAEYEALKGTERWQKVMYAACEDAEPYISWIEELADSDFSKWYTDYNGETDQVVCHHEKNDSYWEDDSKACDLQTGSSIVYSKRHSFGSMDSITYMIVFDLLDSDCSISNKHIINEEKEWESQFGCITVPSQPIIPIAEGMWLLPYLNMHVNYSGEYQGMTMEESIADPNREISIEGVSLLRDGDASEYWYILMEHEGIYRLERLKNMMEKTNME